MRVKRDSILTRLFLSSAGVILLLTGMAKVWSAFGDVKVLDVADPVTGISFGRLLLVVGVVEISAATVCMFKRSRYFALGLVAWLASNFALYRVGLWLMGWRKPCACLGNLTDALGVSPDLADNLVKGLLGYLLLGSYAALFWSWRQRHGTKRVAHEREDATASATAARI